MICFTSVPNNKESYKGSDKVTVQIMKEITIYAYTHKSNSLKFLRGSDTSGIEQHALRYEI